MTDPLLKWRSDFPILSQTTYLISNSLGAMPKGVYDTMYAYADTWASRGVRAWNEGWWEMPVTVGNLAGRLIGAETGQVVMQPNVTTAQATILSCFDFSGAKNKVVTTQLNFPSTLYLYRQMLPPQARLELVPSDDGITIDPERLLGAIDETTALVSISHVIFRSAYLQDAAAIIKKAHAVGAHVVLDAFQSVGVMPVDVQTLNVDVLIGGVLKWLCGGPGGAFLYVRPDLARKWQPRLTGWVAHRQPFAFDSGPMQYADNNFRFLNGTPAIPGLYAAKPGLEIMNQLDMTAVRAKSVRQTERLIALADEYGFPLNTPRDPARRGGTVILNLPNAEAITKELLRRQILVDYRPGAGIRISPHFYNKDEECEAVMAQIQAIAAGVAGP